MTIGTTVRSLGTMNNVQVNGVAGGGFEPLPVLVGCAVSCYGEAPAADYTRERFASDARFDDLFADAPRVVTLSERDCATDPEYDSILVRHTQQATESINQGDTRFAGGAGRTVQAPRVDIKSFAELRLALLDPNRALKIIADQIGGFDKLATTPMDILLDHEFSNAWTSSSHAETYRWFMSQLRHACPLARIDQYGSIARDFVRFTMPARVPELAMMDAAASDARLGVGGACMPHLYVPYRVGTLAEKLKDTSIVQDVAAFRRAIVSNLGRYEEVASRRSVAPNRPGVIGGRVLVISPWVGDNWTTQEDGLTDFTAAPRAGKQALYEIILAAWRRDWRFVVWSACTNARQGELVAKVLQEDVLPAVQAVRAGPRPEWAWPE